MAKAYLDPNNKQGRIGRLLLLDVCDLLKQTPSISAPRTNMRLYNNQNPAVPGLALPAGCKRPRAVTPVWPLFVTSRVY